LEITKTRELAEIETSKFKSMVDAIGAATLQAIATAGPDMQVCHSLYDDVYYLVCTQYMKTCDSEKKNKRKSREYI